MLAITHLDCERLANIFVAAPWNSRCCDEVMATKTTHTSHTSQTTTDHDEIRRWAEERGAKPACVRGTGGKNDVGMLRLDFPGYTGEDKLEPIQWEDWFEKF